MVILHYFYFVQLVPNIIHSFQEKLAAAMLSRDQSDATAAHQGQKSLQLLAPGGDNAMPRVQYSLGHHDTARHAWGSTTGNGIRSNAISELDAPLVADA
ncbi:MAG TPA: hypothetical protein VGM87_02375 [Roseomonas sp.]